MQVLGPTVVVLLMYVNHVTFSVIVEEALSCVVWEDLELNRNDCTLWLQCKSIVM